MSVQCRARRDRGADVGHRHQHPGAASGERLGHGELVEVARIVVVDRAPRQVPQVAHAGAVRADRGLEASYLGEHRGREVGLEATSAHRMPRHAQQQSTLLFSRDTHGRGLQASGVRQEVRVGS